MTVLEETRVAAPQGIGVVQDDRRRRLDVDYLKYRRLLTGALARLSRSGYAVPPDEGLDLIHDFFVEAWDGLTHRFDADTASFETYVYGAFIRFARTRIVRLNRLRSSLFEPHALIALDTPDVSFDERVSSIDTMAVRRTVNRLPPAQRNLLKAYVSDEKPSERVLAQRLGVSRYDLRLRLADALGKLAVELGELGAFNARTSAVSQALWRDNRSIKEAANVLRLRASDIQAVRLGLFRQLTNAVKGETVMSHAEVKIHEQPTSEVPQKRAYDLVSAALSSAATAADFEALRAHADEVWTFLDEPEADALFSKLAGALPPEQIAEVYAALAADESLVSDDADLRGFVEASASDERAIGEAFAKALLPNLKNDLTRFRDRVFLGAPRVDPGYYALLLSEPSVMTGGPRAKELAEFGMTPVVVMEAARAVANRAMRFCRDEKIERYGDLILDLAGHKHGYSSTQVLSRDAAIEEIALATQLPAETASRLFDWLGEVAGYTPNLFDGFDSSLWGDELRLKRIDTVERDLFQRWRPAPIGVAA